MSRNRHEQTPPRKEREDGKTLFVDRGLRAKRSFGQCFLADGNIARAIAREASTPEGGTTVEVGAGTGALTRPLLQRAARVIAIERDRELVPVLEESLASWVADGRLVVVEADAVRSDWEGLLASGPRPHIIAGNVPYQITGRLLEKAIGAAPKVDRVVFMVQREVADRIAALRGTREYGALTVFVARAFVLRKRISVPASCFRPRPEVDSSIIVLESREGVGALDTWFEALVHAAFGKRRKTLRNAWRDIPGLDSVELLAERAGIDLDARAETLGAEDYERMAGQVRSRG